MMSRCRDYEILLMDFFFVVATSDIFVIKKYISDFIVICIVVSHLVHRNPFKPSARIAGRRESGLRDSRLTGWAGAWARILATGRWADIRLRHQSRG